MDLDKALFETYPSILDQLKKDEENNIPLNESLTKNNVSESVVKREKKQKKKKVVQTISSQPITKPTIKHEKSPYAFQPVDKTTLRKLEWHEKIRKYVYPWNKTEWFLCDWHSYRDGQGEPYITICRLIHPHELSEFLEETKHFFGHIDYNAFDKNGIYNEKLRKSTLDPSAEWKDYFGHEPNENDVISFTSNNNQLSCYRFMNGKNGVEFKLDVLNNQDNTDSVNNTNTTNTTNTNNKTIII